MVKKYIRRVIQEEIKKELKESLDRNNKFIQIIFRIAEERDELRDRIEMIRDKPFKEQELYWEEMRKKG